MHGADEIEAHEKRINPAKVFCIVSPWKSPSRITSVPPNTSV
jgi:hypothetical protein